MKRNVFFVAVLLIALISVLPVWARGGSDAASSGKIKVIFIAMDSMDEHWLKVKAGTEDKAKELGNVEISFNAPQGKVDANSQLQLVEDAITRKMDVILLAPLHRDALVPGVEKAKAAGVKVVIIDSAIGTSNYDAFFSTDNGAAARLAADELAKLIGETGKIAIVNAQAGSTTTMIRENDFKDQIAQKYPNITIVGTQYSDGDKTKALNIATDFMTANPDLVGFYATNEGSTVGTGNAIDQAGKAGAIKFVGFDWSADTKALIEKGVLQATMVQNPYQMGYLGVQAAVDLVTGKALATKDADTGVTVATTTNKDSIK
ncbi:MAG: ABC transporter substrate-binding protein [Treponema sp.]|jgi:ribose transport system substrate-binding protein|nr:ABC transporter substrate-binding protein [Treponema sp.]